MRHTPHAPHAVIWLFKACVGSRNLAQTDHWHSQMYKYCGICGVLMSLKVQMESNAISLSAVQSPKGICTELYFRETIVQIPTLTAERDHAAYLFTASRRRAGRAVVKAVAGNSRWKGEKIFF